MREPSPLSPEMRAKLGLENTESEASWFAHLKRRSQSLEVLRRVAVGVYSDGFVQAGNFAYLALVALFSFCIVAAAIAGAFGQTESGLRLVEAFFQTVPPSATAALREPVESAMNSRAGPLLWFSAAVGLWTTASLMEAFRDVLNRAYGTVPQRHFWQYRLASLGSIVLGVIFAMAAFSAQILISTIEDLVYRFIPAAQQASVYFSWGRIVPFLGLFIAIYVIFRGLTPREYRARRYPKWPGAALVSLWWLGCTALLPIFLANLASYSLTYGSLAGVMVALIFFYLIGLGMVSGAQLNAALANTEQRQGQKPIGSKTE